jgi:WD40 repeat protein
MHLFNAETQADLHRLRVSSTGVDQIVFHTSGRWVMAGCRDEPMRIWDTLSGEQVLTGPDSPWALSADGKSFGGGGSFGVSFNDFDTPKIKEFSGDGGEVVRVVWSRNNRHFVSMDRGLRLRTWDILGWIPIDVVAVPPGDFSSADADIAISDDGQQVAYASGGRQSTVLIRDVRKGTELARWTLPAGRERLICLRDNTFLLVREEFDGDGTLENEWRTTVREISAADGLNPPRVIRSAVAGEHGLLDSGLTPDGRYYWWVGPRYPPGNHRADVYNVRSGQRVISAPSVANDSATEINAITIKNGVPRLDTSAIMSQDGRFFWVSGERHQLFDLSTMSAPQFAEQVPVAVSPDSRVVVAYQTTVEPPALVLKDADQALPLIRVSPKDSVQVSALSVRFSHDGRFLTWGSAGGVVTVIDLPDLKKRLIEFERSVSSAHEARQNMGRYLLDR